MRQRGVCHSDGRSGVRAAAVWGSSGTRLLPACGVPSGHVTPAAATKRRSWGGGVVARQISSALAPGRLARRSWGRLYFPLEKAGRGKSVFREFEGGERKTSKTDPAKRHRRDPRKGDAGDERLVHGPFRVPGTAARPPRVCPREAKPERASRPASGTPSRACRGPSRRAARTSDFARDFRGLLALP